MNLKFLATSTLLAGLTVFAWESLSHMVLPWPEVVHEFKDKEAVFQAVRASATDNAVYLDPRGIFTVVSFRRDYGDKTPQFGEHLVKELVLDLAFGFLLSWVLLSVSAAGALGRALLAAGMGLAASVDIHFSYWNWYGFSRGFTIEETLSHAASWFFAGLAISAVMAKMKVGAAAAAR